MHRWIHFSTNCRTSPYISILFESNTLFLEKNFIFRKKARKFRNFRKSRIWTSEKRSYRRVVDYDDFLNSISATRAINGRKTTHPPSMIGKLFFRIFQILGNCFNLTSDFDSTEEKLRKLFCNTV